MGLVHRATLAPSKQELVEAWLPGRAWADGITLASKVAEYRFDDPAGEVGVETIVFATEDDTLVQVPLSYRAAPLAGAEDHLVGTTEHSVLGPRWVYDACIDPVWATALATAIATGGTQVQMFLEDDGARIDIPPRMTVKGSGDPRSATPVLDRVDAVQDPGTGEPPLTRVQAGGLELLVARVIGTGFEADEILLGHVAGRDVVLAGLRRH